MCAGRGFSIRSRYASSTRLGGRSRTSASSSTSSARLRALLRAGIWVLGPSATSAATEGTAVPRVDLDLLPGGDEQRHVDGRAGLHRGRLGAAGGPVALQAGLGVGDLEEHAGRELDVERYALVRGDGGLGLGQQVARPLADRTAGHGDLVVRVQVHEDEVLAV